MEVVSTVMLDQVGKQDNMGAAETRRDCVT